MAWLVLLFFQAGCDESADLPPPKQAPPKPAIEVDASMAARIEADRRITIGHLALVLQHDPADAARMVVTLTSTQPEQDGSRLVLGSFERASSSQQLADRSIYLTTGPRLDLRGNGIFTARVAYQPKFATMKIGAYHGTVARGTISGEFYRFDLLRPTARPRVIQVRGEFRAAAIERP